MEASAAVVPGRFVPGRTGSPSPETVASLRRAAPVGSEGPDEALGCALSQLRDSGATAVADVALLGVAAASEFAGRVEEISRAVEYLQLVAASAVDRARKHARRSDARPAVVGLGADAGGAPVAGTSGGWLTGWQPAEAVPAADTETAAASAATDPPSGTDSDESAFLDDGFRNTTDFLRATLRISAAEARRRLSLAEELLPRTGIADQPMSAARPELAAAVAGGTVASHAASIVTLALNRVRGVCPPDSAARMEHALTLTAVESDQDFLLRIARHWTEALDQDGAEPSEAELRTLQGAFVRRPRRGLQHLEIFATTEQFEHLLSVMNIAANPRLAAGSPDSGSAPADQQNPQACRPDPNAVTGVAGTAKIPNDPDNFGNPDNLSDPDNLSGPNGPEAAAAARLLDQRSRPQKLLDGLIGACKAALASGKLPAAGGLRPQVMVTIDYRDLLDRLDEPASGIGGRSPGTGSLTFTGPVTASTVRKIACDADIIPVLLGGHGRILDIGRASRVFPPHIRKAVAARDGGCAFPQCTIPAPWCEAHHITYWSQGGTTGTDNAALLCSHHHHLMHKEQWTIELRDGVPWFLPPPHVDPRRVARRNTFFRLA